ncbi:MAG: type II toxin-antitoxin system VapC family toxin [Acidobacteria bacterium]|nr:type II toxin-antitoxin system VapC family toxin [Acidobacteriota bacterium]
MGFLLDTNLISEFIKPLPEAAVMDWLNAQPESGLFLSVLTMGEVLEGIEVLPAGRRRWQLDTWYRTELAVRFAHRTLDVDLAVCEQWSRCTAMRARRGRPLPIVDGLLAATALHHGLGLVTRNERDFEGLGLTVVNPWSQPI